MTWVSRGYYVVDGLLRPYTLLLLLTGLALAHLWRRRRESRRRLLLAVVPFGVLVVLSLPAAAYLALGSLEWAYPPLTRRPEGAQAIVVLSGAMIERDSVRTHDVLGDTSLYRCMEAARVYRLGPPLPVVATGGKIDPDTPGLPCAVLMADFLKTQGVAAADIVMEDRARTTFENAAETRRVLEPKGIRSVILVTDATHMARSVLCFRKQGFTVTPWPCSHRATEFVPSASFVFPTPYAVGDCLTAAHEWMGLLWYRLTGKV